MIEINKYVRIVLGITLIIIGVMTLLPSPGLGWYKELVGLAKGGIGLFLIIAGAVMLKVHHLFRRDIIKVHHLFRRDIIKVHHLFRCDMRFLTIPLVLLSIPILLKILSLVTDWIVMDLLNRYVGFFVLESVVIWVILLIWCISRKEFRMPKYMPMFYIIVTLLFFFSLLYTIEFEIPLHKSGEEKKETWWYEVYDKILKDSDAHGILGILMGLICIYIAFLGFQSGLNGVGVVDDLMKLLPIIALMTIFFSITIFGLQKEEFHRITRIIFNAGILLFIPLIYILGCFSRKYSLNGFLGVLFISFLISFCLGFACGYLIIPLTKTQSSSVPLPSLNYYTFSVLMSFLVGITLYQLSEPDSGLSKSVKKFLSIENHNN